MSNESLQPQWPPHKYAFAELVKRGRLDYGKSVTWEEIEELINLGPREGWKFRGEYLSLCQLIKESGYLSTERGMNEAGFRILTRQEMADAVKNKELSKCNDTIRNSVMLSKVPRDGLSETESKKLDHWEEKTAVAGATAKVLLRKRSLPTPEMAIKSIRQIK